MESMTEEEALALDDYYTKTPPKVDPSKARLRIAMASEVLMTISKDEIERCRLMSEYKYITDTQSKVVHARRQGAKEIIDLLKSGKSPDEIIKDWDIENTEVLMVREE